MGKKVAIPIEEVVKTITGDDKNYIAFLKEHIEDIEKTLYKKNIMIMVLLGLIVVSYLVWFKVL